MKIGFVHPRYPSAEGTGATHSASQIVKGLAKAGHKVDVFCTKEPKGKVEVPNINCYYLTGNSHHIHTDTRLNREVESRVEQLSEYDIVHSYLMSLIPSFSKVREETGVCSIVTLNAYKGVCPKNDLLYLGEDKCQRRSNIKCLKCIVQTGFREEKMYTYSTASRLFSLRLINDGKKKLEHISGFQALSDHVKKTYVDFGFPKKRIKVIPNILDEKFLVKHKSDFSNPFNIIYVGSLEKNKGVEMLPEIASYLDNKSTFNFDLTVVGSGSYYSNLKNDFEKKGVLSEIRMEGQVSNNKLPSLYAEHDLFVYPGIWDEPFGRVLIESLAAGTPIVGANVGAFEDIVGSAGLATEPKPEKIGEAIDRLVGSGKIKELAKNTKTEARRFSQQKVIKKFESFYEKTLSR
jgi:glycosyltransferase involved in cell wall biosynthesis